MRKVIFLDIDGVINAIDPETSGVVTEPFDFVFHIGEGFHSEREGHFDVPVDTLTFLRNLEQNNIELWWVTGWKEKGSSVVAPLLGITSAGFLDWTLNWNDSNAVITELGKKIAVESFLKDNPDISKFVWADDIATVNKLETGIPNMHVLTKENVGLSGEILKKVCDFFEIMA